MKQLITRDRLNNPIDPPIERTLGVTDLTVELLLDGAPVFSTLLLEDYVTFVNRADDWLSVFAQDDLFDTIRLTHLVESFADEGFVDTTVISDLWVARGAAVSEPGSAGLLGIAVLALVARRRCA